MAYLYRRPNGRVEIREAHATPRGPRSRSLVTFRGALTDALLDRAEAAARRPFDRIAIAKRASDLGIAMLRSRADGPARELLARLRRGAPLDPRLATLVRERLGEIEALPIPPELADVVEWIGASDAERGHALRDVLRLYDTIARSREPVRTPPPLRFPRIPPDSERRSAS
jgi:hypothetical protein